METFKKIAKDVKRKLLKEHKLNVPIAIFAKGAHFGVEDLQRTEFDVIAVDWTMDPWETKKTLRFAAGEYKQPKVLQGNLDPAVLYAKKRSY